MKIRETISLESNEVLTMCEGYKPLRDANKLLRPHGFVIRWRGAGGDQVIIKLIKLPDREHQDAGPGDRK